MSARAPPERLRFLFLSQWLPSPATFGAQRRVEGLLVALARSHSVSCVAMASPDADVAAAERAMRAYCETVVLVQGRADRGAPKRLLQLRSLASLRSFERHQLAVPGVQRALDRLLRRTRHDVVVVEAPHLMVHPVRLAPPGEPPPAVVLDEHNVEYDLARQSRDASGSVGRRLYHAVNWRKIRREERSAWKAADGVAFTSEDDAARARAAYPAIRARVVPNAVDVDAFVPRAAPPAGRPTVAFFGTLDYFPNQDGMLHFLREIWPILSRRNPEVRLEVVGPRPSPEVLAYRGPRVDVLGLVDDVRPHLAAADVVVVPLRVGGGTRFKVLEAMAMGRPVVSTRLGAEGIAAEPGRHLLLEDAPEAFAEAVAAVLADGALARRLGEAGRRLVEERYSWRAAAADFERFARELVAGVGGRSDGAPRSLSAAGSPASGGGSR